MVVFSSVTSWMKEERRPNLLILKLGNLWAKIGAEIVVVRCLRLEFGKHCLHWRRVILSLLNLRDNACNFPCTDAALAHCSWVIANAHLTAKYCVCVPLK